MERCSLNLKSLNAVVTGKIRPRPLRHSQFLCHTIAINNNNNNNNNTNINTPTSSLIASFSDTTKFHPPSASSQQRLSSISEGGNGNSQPGPGAAAAAASAAAGVANSVSSVSQNKLLHVVLVSPQIPGNAGCIARTCAASAVGLHLVGPLGFKVDDTKLKRAGLDYWPYVVLKVHRSWAEFQEYFRQQEGNKRLLAFTKRGAAIHSDFSYRKGDYLIFGSETCGLPPDVLLDCKSETFGGGTIRIPMVETYVRCLNLSVSVGIALYEASRQLNYEQLQGPSGDCSDYEQSFLTEDIFA